MGVYYRKKGTNEVIKLLSNGPGTVGPVGPPGGAGPVGPPGAQGSPGVVILYEAATESAAQTYSAANPMVFVYVAV